MVQLSLSEVSLNHFHILVVVSVVRKKLDDFIDVICVILQVGANILVTEETLIKGFQMEVVLFGCILHLGVVHLLLLLVANA
mgnify:FL=1